VGVWVGGIRRQTYSSKDAQENSTSFDINVVGDGANMVFNEKLTKNRKLRRLKLRGLRRNQINTPNFGYHGTPMNVGLIPRNFKIFIFKLKLPCLMQNNKNHNYGEFQDLVKMAFSLKFLKIIYMYV